MRRLIRNFIVLCLSLSPGLILAQCSNSGLPFDCLPAPFAAGGAVGASSVFCIGDVVGVYSTSTGAIDSSYICWGDGTISGFTGNFNDTVYHQFNFRPDSCVGSSGIIQNTIYIFVSDTCASGITTTWNSFPISIKFKPHAQFQFVSDTICEYEDVSINTLGSCGNTTNANYTWDFGDGTVVTSTTSTPPQHFYTSTGIYTVKFVIDQGTAGCGADSVSHSVHVEPSTFVYPSVTADSCAPQIIIPSIISNNVSSYLWSVPQGGVTITTPVDSTPTFTFTNGGAYTINLTATGCCFGPSVCNWDTSFTLYQGPSLTVNTIPPSCNSANIDPLLYFNITNPNNIITGYQWLFPGGNPASSAVPAPGNITYATAGVYPLTLIVTSPCGNDTIVDTLKIGIPPVINITPLSFTGCNSLLAAFTNTSPAGQTYNWTATGGTFVNGTTSTSSSPEINFAAPGNYSINVTASSPGCANIQQVIPVTVGQSPQLTQLATVPDDCDSSFTLFWNTLYSLIPDVSDSGYTWELSRGGTVLTLDHSATPPGTVLNNTGQYTLYVLAWNNCDSVEFRDTFNITAPVVLVMPNDTTVCKSSASFTLLTNATGGTWTVNGIPIAGNIFDPNTATIIDNNLVYSYGGASCAVKDSFIVHVTGADVSLGNDISLCSNTSPFQLNATPAGGIFSGTGITNSTTGAYDPSLLVTNSDVVIYTVNDAGSGCVTKDTMIITLFSSATGSFASPDTSCTGLIIIFRDTIPNTTAQWNFGDSTTIVTLNPANHSYVNTGSYTISLIVTDTITGCIDTITKPILILRFPDATFTLNPKSGCADLPVIITNTSTFSPSTTYIWDYGFGTPDTVYNPGIINFPAGAGDSALYKVYLYTNNQCGTFSDLDTVVVYSKPLADFGIIYNDSCSPAYVQFANVTAHKPDSYEWFIDGVLVTTDSVLAPRIFIASTSDSVYHITLIATNECGSDTVNKDVVVHPNTVHAFFNTDVLIGCKPLTVTFTSFVAPNATIQWDFGDGNLATGDTVVHVFDTSGVFTIWQYVDNFCGFDSASQTIEVFPEPDVSFTTGVVNCINSPVQFMNTSVNTLGSVWDFGDSSPLDSTQTNPSHQYPGPGFYHVYLTGIASGTACRATFDSVIRVFDIPDAVFTIPQNNGCQPLLIQLDGNNSLNAAYFQWDLGNGDTLNGIAGSIQQYFYNNPGSYTIQLTVTDVNGCKDDTLFSPVNVHANPDADFTYTQQPPCNLPSAIQIQNLTVDGDGFTWNMGVYGISNAHDPVINVAAVDSFVVALYADNLFGCKDTVEKVIEVYDAIRADFTVDFASGCYPFEVLFTNSSTGASQYWWNFGDNYFSTEFTTSHVYTTPGIYTVTLTVNNDSVCADSIIALDLIEVFPSAGPDALFTVDHTQQSIVNPVFVFTNLSAGYDSLIWTFGDGSFSNEFSPVHIYADTGTYLVMLIVKNEFDCPDTMRQVVIVNPEFAFYIPNSFTPNGDLKNDVFNVQGWYIADVQLRIIDRWGQPVFSSSGVDAKGWDGTLENGKEAPIGVYIYDFTLWEPNHVKHTRRGKVFPAQWDPKLGIHVT